MLLRVCLASLAIAMLASITPAEACDSSLYFRHIGTGLVGTDKVSGGWIKCDSRSGSCFHISRLYSHADIRSVRTMLDILGQRKTPAWKTTYDDVSYNEVLNFAEPGTC